MKSYSELSNSIQILLEDHCRNNRFENNPSELYSGIVETVKHASPSLTAKTFNISVSLVEMIKSEVDNDCKDIFNNELREF